MTETIKELQKLFETKGNDEDTHVSFTMDALKNKPFGYEELSNIIYESDISFEYSYQWTVDALDAIEDMNPANGDEWHDNMHEYAESDAYTLDLLKWLSASLYHLTFLDDTMKENETAVCAIVQAQHNAKCEIFNAVYEAVEKLSKETK